jgi:hypothetical protein
MVILFGKLQCHGTDKRMWSASNGFDSVEVRRQHLDVPLTSRSLSLEVGNESYPTWTHGMNNLEHNLKMGTYTPIFTFNLLLSVKFDQAGGGGWKTFEGTNVVEYVNVYPSRSPL